MPETHDIGRAHYWHLQHYPNFAEWEIPVPPPRFTEAPAVTREIEPPYRTGYGRVYRMWPSRWALVVGRWQSRVEEEAVALQQAHAGRVMDEIRTEDIQQW